MRAISLFSGAGGMDVGFQQAGFTVIAANEIDPHACQTFRANHKETTLYEGNINHYIETLAQYTDIDVVFGGPPCQGFSVAGKMDSNDPRSQLIFSFAQVVECIKPKAFVMENVKALGTLEKFQTVREQLLKRFHQAGYSVSIIVLNAKNYGIPQARERVFFIGFLNTHQVLTLENFKPYLALAPSLRSVLVPLGKAGSRTNQRVCNAKITLATKPVLRQSPYAGMLFNGQGRPLNPDGWSSTLPASMGGNRTPIIDEAHLFDHQPAWVEFYHHHLMQGGQPLSTASVPNSLRRLTVDEAALLQGFPSDYVFKGAQSRVFCQIGNAVPCKLAQVVGKVVYQVLQQPKVSQNDQTYYPEQLKLAV